MKKIIKKWNSISLILRIVAGLAVGIAVALIFPGASAVGMLGTLFVGALKAIAPVLVFVLVISSLCNAKSNIGSQFTTVIMLYMISTFLAAVVAVVFSFTVPVELSLTQDAVNQVAPSGIAEVFVALIQKAVANPIDAIVNANYIGILTWSIVLGLALRKAKEGTKNVLIDISDAVSTGVRWIINLAPFGVMGLIYTAIVENGVGIFATYGKLLAVLIGCMLTVGLVVDPLIAAITLRQNPYPLVFKCLKESGIMAFFTRSSAANIPVNMQLCEKLGLDRDVYSVSIPLGATINMDGAAITITVMTLAAAHSLGISVDITTAIVLSFLSAVGACGASGVAGGSLLLIPMACSLFGIPNDVAMQVVAVGFIIGVVQDSFETAINSAGDVMFAATAEYRQWMKDGRKVNLKEITHGKFETDNSEND